MRKLKNDCLKDVAVHEYLLEFFSFRNSINSINKKKGDNYKILHRFFSNIHAPSSNSAVTNSINMFMSMS